MYLSRTVKDKDLGLQTSGVTGSVRGTRLPTDGGEPHRDGGLGADLLEESRARQVRDIVGDLEETMGTRTLRVDDTLCSTSARSMSPSTAWGAQISGYVPGIRSRSK